MKYISYGKQAIDKSDIDAVIKVLKSDWITQGPCIQRFETAIGEYTGAKYAVVVSSGTAALHLACLAAGIRQTDEVITSPITFVASANCILYCGGRPVFADVEEDTINIDPEEVEKKVTRKTKAIIPIDFAGHPVELEKILKIAKKKRDIMIIEDAAHALGAEYKGVKVGSCKYSDMTVFSFHPVKHITTGEGGAVTTNNGNLYQKLLILRNHGIVRDKDKLDRCDGPWQYEQQFLGFNYRITDFQCALGISQFKKINTFLKKRREIAAIYNEELADIDGIKLPIERPYINSSWHIYHIRIKDWSCKKKVFNKLRRAGLGVQVHYIPVHLQPYYRKTFGYREHDYARSENYYKETITIPLYPKMGLKEVKYVIRAVRKALK